MRAILVFLCLCSPLFAETKKLGHFTVSDDIVTPRLPEFTKQMTPEEYFVWAIQANRQLEDESAARAQAYRENRSYPGITFKNFNTQSGGTQTRFGGGVGYGGLGGNGGYAGYGQGSSNGVGGGLYGNSFQGNAAQSSFSNSASNYSNYYLDRNDGGGGPLLILNPYCPPR